MITPISLESEVEIVKDQLERVRGVGAERFHIDIIDGLFADNITVGPADLGEIDFGKVKVDLHLLVDDPTTWIEECAAIKPERIFAQIERMDSIENFVKTLRGYGKIKAGLALDIETPAESITRSELNRIDGILLMSVRAGFSGQKFNEQVLEKIIALRKIYRGTIVVDGGITPETYAQVIQVGATEAGANSALWKGSFEDNFKKFMEVEAKW